MSSVENIVKRLRESRMDENAQAEYVCKRVTCDSNGVMNVICYDTVEDEEFEKYIGQVDDFSARKNARLLLKDWKFEVPKDVKNELIGTFGLEEFGYSIEESDKSMEFATDEEAYEWAEANGYKVDKIQQGQGEKSCMCWMSKIDEAERYLSSFDKEVMDVVGEEAPSALYWREGDKIYSSSSKMTATFKGYQKNSITGRYKAVFEYDPGQYESDSEFDKDDVDQYYEENPEIFYMDLPTLQREIRNERLIKQEDTKEATPPVEGGWEYWDMPKDYKGPWQQDHFWKDYGNDILGFIYPPFEANVAFLKDMTHTDYVAFLYDNRAAADVDSKSFPKMKDARAWLDELAAYTLEKR